MSTAAWIVVAVIVVVVVAVVIATVLTGGRRRTEHRRTQARALREEAQEHDVTVQRREAEAAEAQARARAAQAEADAQAARASQLQADAQRRTQHARSSRSEIDDRLRKADEIDPDVRADDDRSPVAAQSDASTGSHRVSVDGDTDGTREESSDVEPADRRSAEQRGALTEDELAARDADQRQPDDELRHVDLTQRERLEEAHTRRDRPYGSPAT